MMIRRLFLLLTCMTFIGCGEETKMVTIENLDELNWEKINSANIYFGHKSVGRDLMEGLEIVRAKYPQFSLPINELDVENTGAVGIYQTMIGENRDPQSKLTAFFDEQSAFAQEDSVVAMKFCYIDIHRGTDVGQLFSDYQARVNTLAQQYPNKRLIHFTAPLTHDAKDLKSRIKRLLGKPVRGYEENLLRKQYNEMVLQTYGEENVFDIARFESTGENGTRVQARLGDQQYYAMHPAYTSDGGHLNPFGKEYLASEFLKFLSTYL